MSEAEGGVVSTIVGVFFVLAFWIAVAGLADGCCEMARSKPAPCECKCDCKGGAK